MAGRGGAGVSGCREEDEEDNERREKVGRRITLRGKGS
jgi:hypothetical protein